MIIIEKAGNWLKKDLQQITIVVTIRIDKNVNKPQYCHDFFRKLSVGKEGNFLGQLYIHFYQPTSFKLRFSWKISSF